MKGKNGAVGDKAGEGAAAAEQERSGTNARKEVNWIQVVVRDFLHSLKYDWKGE